MKKDKLTILREEIDKIDDQLVFLLAKRAEVVLKIKEFKKKKKIRIVDKKREKEVLQRAKKRAKTLGLPQVLVEKLLKLIIQQSRKLQEK